MKTTSPSHGTRSLHSTPHEPRHENAAQRRLPSAFLSHLLFLLHLLPTTPHTTSFIASAFISIYLSNIHLNIYTHRKANKHASRLLLVPLLWGFWGAGGSVSRSLLQHSPLFLRCLIRTWVSSSHRLSVFGGFCKRSARLFFLFLEGGVGCFSAAYFFLTSVSLFLCCFLPS